MTEPAAISRHRRVLAPRLPRGPLSLRARLLATLVGLLIVAFLVAGSVTLVSLRHFLVGRLDTQLTAASSRSNVAAGTNGYDHDDGPPSGMTPGSVSTTGTGEGTDTGTGTAPTTAPFVTAPGQAVGTLGASVASGTVTQASVLTASGTNVTLSTKVDALLAKVPADGHFHTETLTGLGSYRLLAVNRDGSVMVTGLSMRDVDTTVTRATEVGGAVAGIAVLLAALAGLVIVRMTLRPLRRVAGTAIRVSELPLDRGEVPLVARVPTADTDPRTEVGAVGAAVNRMLSHVDAALSARQASETRVRQFVADASHELRTPLAAIRGYAELSRRSANAVPDDVARALRRVESEAARMTTLVEDLLLLARLDSGRPLALDDVDLSAVVIDAASDAYALSPDHRWELDLPPDAVTVIGDSQRLHQVVTNLLANVARHTPAGTTAVISLVPAPEGARRSVTMTIVDNGPGIPPELLPQVFERFARGDSSRSRAAGSTGLGLAIVSAVVVAHAGQVHVTSVPGRTEFRVTLPAAGAAVPALVAS